MSPSTLLAVVLGPAVQASPTLAPLFTISHNGICIALIIYGFIAAALPVWLLLAPRDYLSTYMKIGTIGALALGILIVGPQIQMPATTQFCAGGGPVHHRFSPSVHLRHHRLTVLFLVSIP